MIRMFEPRQEILPLVQRLLWPRLAPAAGIGFVLYGGTAIALRLGHRNSVDFDFFSEIPLDRGRIAGAMPFLSGATVLQDEENALGVLVASAAPDQVQVKVSFFGSIGFGRVGVPEATADRVLLVASLDDLMATKLKVVLQRAEAKDYRDIAAMIVAGVDLSRGLSAARAIFGPNFQPAESLKALNYFADGDLRTLTKQEKDILVNAAGAVGALPEVAIVSRRLANSDAA